MSRWLQESLSTSSILFIIEKQAYNVELKFKVLSAKVNLLHFVRNQIIFLQHFSNLVGWLYLGFTSL